MRVSISCEEVDGEKMELEKGLEEPKGKAEELSETFTIVANTGVDCHERLCESFERSSENFCSVVCIQP